jgi:SAM-dependent methyltransferase
MGCVGNCVEQDELLLHASSFGVAATAYASTARTMRRPRGALGARVRARLAGARPRRRNRQAHCHTGYGGADATAVEPDPAMLTELRALPDVRALPGSAEVIPLPDVSVDAVLAVTPCTRPTWPSRDPEIARVLVPGGILAGLWSVMDDRVDWLPG